MKVSVLRAAALAAALIYPGSICFAVTLIHSNDVLGEIEPCGCRKNPQGGMSRKANLLSKQADQNYVQVDTGDLLFNTEKIAPLMEKQSELQARYLLRAMEQLHHDIIVPGEKEFALGFKAFERLRSKTKIPFLAANLLRKDNKPFLKSTLILTRKKKDGTPLRIGFIGLVGDELAWPKELKATSPLATAKGLISSLKKDADLVVALTHQGETKDRELAEKISGIDIIIGAHSQSFLQEPVRVGKTVIYQSSYRNQHIGVISLENAADQERTYELIGLDPAFDSPEGKLTATDHLVSEFKAALEKLNLEEEKKDAKKAETGAHRESHFQTFPACLNCHAKQFEFWRKTNHALALTTLVAKSQAANKECLACHTVGLGAKGGFQDVSSLSEFRDLSAKVTTPAFSEFLKAMHDAKDLEQEVGLGTEPNKQSIKRWLAHLDRAWTPVQCESCHGPTSNHPFGEAKPANKAVPDSTCLSCHTHERAPEWYNKDKKPLEKVIREKRALIACPKSDPEMNSP